MSPKLYAVIECVASGRSCSIKPCGPGGALQCEWCGEGSPMTPSQEAREYPPQEELSITLLANQHGCRRGDGAITFEQSDLLRFVRSYVDADRKARQQEAQAWVDVLAERRRQVEAEGWTAEHDDEHDSGEMAGAASAYALAAADKLHPMSQGDGEFYKLPPAMWPWDYEWWKPSWPRRMLVKAGALILAEIERLDRAAIAKGASQP